MPDNLWRENIWNPVALYRVLSTSYPSLMRIVRFVVSGGTATAVNLGILFVLTHLFGLWYLLSSVIAFLGAYFVRREKVYKPVLFVPSSTWCLSGRRLFSLDFSPPIAFPKIRRHGSTKEASSKSP